MMEGYRYEVTGDFVGMPHSGLITTIEDAFAAGLLTSEEVWELLQPFDEDLDEPCINMGQTISYFTEEGLERFADPIAKLSDKMESLGAQVHKVRRNLTHVPILYDDQYQIIVRRDG